MVGAVEESGEELGSVGLPLCGRVVVLGEQGGGAGTRRRTEAGHQFVSPPKYLAA